MVKPEDLKCTTGGWSNIYGYEVRVNIDGYSYNGNKDWYATIYRIKGMNDWLFERSGAKRMPSFSKIKEYLKTDEGKQFIWACMWDEAENYDKNAIINQDSMIEYYGFVPNKN